MKNPLISRNPSKKERVLEKFPLQFL